MNTLIKGSAIFRKPLRELKLLCRMADSCRNLVELSKGYSEIT